jgi:ribosomal protein S12 methylthiotransferase accessory factor YcaO
MSARMSFLSYLSRGEQVTAKQARTMFKISNVADLVYRLRNEGFPVYTKRITTSRGEETFAYRLGEPNKGFTGNRASRHIARARAALYTEALSAQ